MKKPRLSYFEEEPFEYNLPLRKAFYKDFQKDRRKWCGDASGQKGTWICTRPKKHRGWHESIKPKNILFSSGIWKRETKKGMLQNAKRRGFITDNEAKVLKRKRLSA